MRVTKLNAMMNFLWPRCQNNYDQRQYHRESQQKAPSKELYREGLSDSCANNSNTKPELDARKHERYPVRWAAQCSDDSGRTWITDAVNTSIGGLGLSPCPQLASGQVLQVHLSNIGEFRCRVAWSQDSRCGVEFLPDDDQTDPDALLQVLKAIAKLAPV